MLKKFGAQQQLTPNVVSAWPGGLNTTFGLFSNPEVQIVTSAIDVNFDKDATICTRAEIQPFSMQGTGVVKNPIFYENQAGDFYVIWMDDAGVLKYIVNGPSTVQDFPYQIGAGKGFLSSFQAHHKLYLSNGVKTVSWDGGGAIDVTTTAFHVAVTAAGVQVPAEDKAVTDQGVPAFSQATVWSGAAWLVDPVYNTAIPDHEDEVWYSAFIGTYDGILKGEKDYANSRSLAFSSPLDADRVTKIIGCGDSLVVFKHNQVAVVRPSHSTSSGASGTSFGQTSFLRNVVTNDVGLAGVFAVSGFSESIVFLDKSKGLFSMNASGQLQLMSTAIQDKIDEILNPEIAAVGTYRNYVYLSVAMKQTVFNDTTYVYDTFTKTWTSYSRGFQEFISVKPTGKQGKLIGVAISPARSLVLLDGETKKELLDNYGSSKHSYFPLVRTKFFDFGGVQSYKTPECTTFTFESKTACVRISNHKDWDYTVESNAVHELKGKNTACYYGPGGVCFAHRIVEVLDASTTREVADCSTMNTAVENGVTQVNVGDKCQFVANAHTVNSISGHWCLRRITTLFKQGRLKF